MSTGGAKRKGMLIDVTGEKVGKPLPIPYKLFWFVLFKSYPWPWIYPHTPLQGTNSIYCYSNFELPPQLNSTQLTPWNQSPSTTSFSLSLSFFFKGKINYAELVMGLESIYSKKYELSLCEGENDIPPIGLWTRRIQYIAHSWRPFRPIN